MNKKLSHIVAYSVMKNKYVDLYYYSIEDARQKNPYLINFREVEYE